MKRLLLAGGGHAHVFVLEALARTRPAGVEVTLVTPFPRLFYSGMLPGWIAGHYALDDCAIPLAPLAERAGAKIAFAERAAPGARMRPHPRHLVQVLRFEGRHAHRRSPKRSTIWRRRCSSAWRSNSRINCRGRSTLPPWPMPPRRAVGPARGFEHGINFPVGTSDVIRMRRAPLASVVPAAHVLHAMVLKGADALAGYPDGAFVMSPVRMSWALKRCSISTSNSVRTAVSP